MNASAHPQEIVAGPLQREAYRPYGDLVAAEQGRPSVSANDGTARRFDHLGEIENLRPGVARPNFCVFRVQPFTGASFEVRLLERHRHSTQAFIPMAGAGRYLVVVCAGREAPDLRSLMAFVAQPGHGITYRPGTWHHPLIALDRTADFACLVHEDGSAADCDLRQIEPAVRVTY